MATKITVIYNPRRPQNDADGTQQHVLPLRLDHCPARYADPVQFPSGTPYGTSFVSNNGNLDPDETALNAARFQSKRVAEVTTQFIAGHGQNS